MRSGHIGSCHCKSTPAHSFQFYPAQQTFIYCQLASGQDSEPVETLSPVPYLSLFLGRLSDLASSCFCALISVLISSSFLSLSILNTGPILCSLSLIHPSWMDKDIYLLKKKTLCQKHEFSQRDVTTFFFFFLK